MNSSKETSGFQNEVINCPMPFPFPFPTGPFGPFGPFGPGGPFLPGGPIFNHSGSGEDNIFHQALTMALGLEIQKGHDPKKLNKHIDEEVLPKIKMASTIEEVDSTMKKVYEAYPAIKEYVHTTYTQFGGNAPGAPSFIWPVVVFIIRVIIFIIIAIKGAKPAQ